MYRNEGFDHLNRAMYWFRLLLLWFGFVSFYFLFIAFCISVQSSCLRAKTPQLLLNAIEHYMRLQWIQFARTNAIILSNLNLLSLMQCIATEMRKLTHKQTSKKKHTETNEINAKTSTWFFENKTEQKKAAQTIMIAIEPMKSIGIAGYIRISKIGCRLYWITNHEPWAISNGQNYGIGHRLLNQVQM